MENDSAGNGEDRSRSSSTVADDHDIPVAESELKSILSTIDDAVFVFSVEYSEDSLSFTFQWNNHAHETITGMTVDEFGGLGPKEFLGERVGADVVTNYRKCVERRDTIEYEETLEHQEGQVTWHTKLVPVIEDDSVIQIIGMARDITELTERTKHLQVVDRMLRHDIRNVLNVIRGRARLIEAEADESVAGDANQITESSNDLLRTAEKARLINQVIVEDSPTTTLRVDSLTDDVTTLLSETDYEANVSVTVDRSEQVVASPRLSDAIVELVRNADDHHDQPESAITITLSADDDTIEVIIADDGPGIPEAERGILVNGQPPNALAHGTGLGMWLVYWVVHRSDGEIIVDDREPRGSVVKLCLPRIVEGQ